ncbi:MAG: S8 family serine peptidase, partial [Cyanobacteria bacterium P01_A01_bin.135]
MGQDSRRPATRRRSPTAGYGLINIAAAIARTTRRHPPTPLPSADMRWNLRAVNAPSAWASGARGQGQVVAVIDTGVDLNHPDLRRNLWRNRDEIPGNGVDDDRNGFVDDHRGWDFVRHRPRPQDSNGHGTHVAGIIAAADNGKGTTGVAPLARIMPIRVLGPNGADDVTLARGIRYAVRNGANVINLSLGGEPGMRVSPVVRRSLHLARRRGVSVVLAAGNERRAGAIRSGEPAFWAATRRLGIAVGATTIANRTADFSNPTGNSRFNWFVVAPGKGVTSTFLGGRVTTLSGTSMAVPHVAG